MTTNTRFALLLALAVCTIMSGLIGLQLIVAFAQTSATGPGIKQATKQATNHP